MGERISRLEWAKKTYKPGMAFKSAWSGAVFITSLNAKFSETNNLNIYVSTEFGGSIDTIQVMVYDHSTSTWGETIESIPFSENYNSTLPKDNSEDVPKLHLGGMNREPDPEASEEPEKLIRRFETGAVRSDSTGRPRPDWISPYAIEEISKVMVDNENEFGSCNYMLGIPELKCLESLCRHVEELKEALLIEKDFDKGRKIARAAGFNVTAMLHTMVLKERGLYKKVFDKEEELIPVSEAKKGINFTDK